MTLFALLAYVIAACAVGCGLLMTVNAISWPRPAPQRQTQASSDAEAARNVSILIPARNEADNLPGLLASLLASDPESSPGDVSPLEPASAISAPIREVLVLDDRSSDPTAEVVLEFSRRQSSVRLIRGTRLPDGWCGKPWALSQLATEASGDWLLMLDADARLRPGAVDAMVSEAVSRGAGLVSFWPYLENRSFAERWLMPMLDFVMLGLFPTPVQFIYRWPVLGIAHGACILVNREEYFQMAERLREAEEEEETEEEAKVAGHAVVRDEIFEDTALARAFRRAGGLSLCLDGQALVWVRMYDSVRGIWNGFAKNFYPGFRSPISFWAFLAFRFLVFFLPFLMLAIGPWIVLSASFFRTFAVAVFAIVVGRVMLLLARRQSLWSVLLHPLSELFVISLGLTSWWRVQSGAGVEWKGRVYHRRAGSDTAIGRGEDGPNR